MSFNRNIGLHSVSSGSVSSCGPLDLSFAIQNCANVASTYFGKLYAQARAVFGFHLQGSNQQKRVRPTPRQFITWEQRLQKRVSRLSSRR
jgi:hypothetical protein